jgi:rubredoxin
MSDIHVCPHCKETVDLDKLDDEMFIGANEYRGHFAYEFLETLFICPHCNGKVEF